MINVLIGIILAALTAWAGFKVYKRARQGSACCAYACVKRVIK